ncbi:hypothetical protein NXV82_12335 [Bacteroides thetaiotaomicron]|nr:hypothetical protein [Bacteroides thetaiotaomicron]MCS2667007.1 hypothetical protein [Phocaeicola vulgatus]MCS2291718.1 hypothetical protein [Bacteroides thetaiotaomicron]MCS2684776.1 hypothetical protein [Bacteroides thetaiotaomicron]MCS2714028.1 hypothetical protein [Bacteroides thetaiotaomicron]MCS3072374.1 hypothetical protein [Bacteroides thetaiotaomicron]
MAEVTIKGTSVKLGCSEKENIGAIIFSFDCEYKSKGENFGKGLV